MKLNYVCLLVFFLFISSCSGNRRLQFALDFAGDNRGELEKVLDYYKDSTLKYRAACFLIENMPYYYAYSGWQLDSMKSLRSRKVYSQEAMFEWAQKAYGLEKVYDCKVITADYLIRNIDCAFKVWNSRSWCRCYSFDEFCEYVLPYRISNEPLEDWRTGYYHKYNALLDTMQVTDVVEAADIVAKSLKAANFYYIADYPLPHVGANYLDQNKMGTCIETTDYPVYVMRALGIPIAIDYFLESPRFSGGMHMWNAIIDTTGQTIPYYFYDYKISRSGDGTDKRKKGKVFRKSWRVQRIGNFSYQGVDSRFSDCFSFDVTSDYFGANEALIDVPESLDEEYVYLGIFRLGEFVPIDTAKAQKAVAHFRNLEQNVIYTPIVRKGSAYVSAGYPFKLNDNNQVHQFKADKSNRQSILLKRKYPMQVWFNDYLRNICGATFAYGAKPGLSDSKLFYRIPSIPKTNFNAVNFETIQCRYIHFCPVENNPIELADLLFYSRDTINAIVPKVIGCSEPFTDPEHLSDISHVLDQDPVTFFTSLENPCYISFDFGKMVELNRIVYIPRNDDNYVWNGHLYELFFHDGANGWQSLGKRMATGAHLVYENAPGNSVFLLRDLSKGKEEQLFYYSETGEQVFP